MPQVEYLGQIYEYSVEYKAIKNAYIRFRDGKYFITANKKFSGKQLKEFLINSLPRFAKREKKKMGTVKLDFSYEDGSTIYFRGEPYTFHYVVGNSGVAVLNDKIIASFPINDIEYITTSMENWFIDQMEVLIKELYPWLNRQISPYGLRVSGISIKKMSSRYGSCNVKTKKIVMNSQLVKLDVVYTRFVLMHEATHLRVPNHSADFYAFLDILCPSHRELKNQLKRFEI